MRTAVVLGAGIVGSAVAYHLVRAGADSVVLLDPSPGSFGATGRSAGVLTFQGWGAWDLGLVRESAEEYRDLSDSSGRGGYRQNGGVRVARTHEGAAWIALVRDHLERASVTARPVGTAELSELVPWGAWSEIAAGLWTPADAVFSAAELAGEYARRAARLGAICRLGMGNVRADRGRSGWEVTCADATFEADALVVAAGAWTRTIVGQLGVRLPATPFRSRAAVIRPGPLVAPFPTVHDLDLDLYLRPSSTGRVLAGDGTERHEAEPGTSDLAGSVAFRSSVTERLRGVAEGWERLSVEDDWDGLCVASPDRFPIVGECGPGHGLFVATGFNGLGAMRAGGLARRLADGIVHGRWEELRPADPRRFPDPAPDFEVRPEFPLEGPIELVAAADRGMPRAVPVEHDAPSLAPEFVAVADRVAVDRLDLPSLSEWFDPFLRLFARDALRTGGTVELATVGGAPVGLALRSPAEEVGSVFTRCRPVAEHYLARIGPGGLYTETAWRDGAQAVDIFAADLRDWELRHAVRNPVRIAGPADLPAVREFVAELDGPVDEAWFGSLPRSEEVCFLGEIEGRVAGVSWASVAGAYARGHSFLVRPRFRGLGLGTDLLHARMLWLRSQGVVQVVSEIYDGNAASRAAAERAGMARVGRMYHFFRGPGPT